MLFLQEHAECTKLTPVRCCSLQQIRIHRISCRHFAHSALSNALQCEQFFHVSMQRLRCYFAHAQTPSPPSPSHP